MIVKESAEARQTLDAILEQICISLQITPTQFKDAEKKYNAVCEWLAANGSPVAGYKPHMYSQGSLKIDTTVRPFGQNEFDLDVVCQLDIKYKADPQYVFDLIYDRMADHGTYKHIIERKRRCIRVNYANDFHLDIVPAIPDMDTGGSCIYVPDIPKPKLKYWKPSNPLGYAEWFAKQVAKRLVLNFAESQNRDHDPLETPRPAHLKQPLQLAVQLFKRWRDIRFADRMDLSPPSIILTTMSGHAYVGDSDYADALTTILNAVVAFVKRGKPKIYNPVNNAELISERWEDNDESFQVFVSAVTEFRDRWVEIITMRGLPKITDELTRLFGEPVKKAIKEAFDAVEKGRTNGQLYVNKSNGNLMSASAALPTLAVPSSAVRVRGNTFYGD